MNSRAFIDPDLLTLNVWLRSHGMDAATRRELPSLGFIVPNVACGFLCQTDTNVAFLEGFITNPHAVKAARNNALDVLTRDLVSLGRRLDFTRILFVSRDESILRRAQLHGFTACPDYVVGALELKG